MRMITKAPLAAAFALATGLSAMAAAPAHAATVSPQQSVTFAFDLSSTGDVTFDRFSYFCAMLSCLVPGNPGRLEDGASFTLDFGTMAFGSDIGTDTFTNTAGFDVFNGRSGLTPRPFVNASVSTLFVTLSTDDDSFNVRKLNLGAGRTQYKGQFAGVAAVPLPAGIGLLVAALGLLGVTARRRRA
ncbi:MAG: hypothetical protein ACWA5A_07870 [Marinibacterium sp.]